jgi:hypothetical protein
MTDIAIAIVSGAVLLLMVAILVSIVKGGRKR